MLICNVIPTVATAARKISFLYLANDVIQNSKKKGDELPREFAKILPDAFIHVHRWLSAMRFSIWFAWSIRAEWRWC